MTFGRSTGASTTPLPPPLRKYGAEQTRVTSEAAAGGQFRIGMFGEGLSSALLAATAAWDAIQSGRVGVAGSTGTMLGRTLSVAKDLHERLQVEIASVTSRFGAEGQSTPEIEELPKKEKISS